MSRIDELLEEFCPEGVQVSALGQIATLVRGNGMPKSDLTDSGVGAIHYGQIYTKYGTWTDRTISFVSEETALKLVKADTGDIIITNTSENLTDVGKAVAWLGDSRIVTGGHATIIKHSMEPKYLAYWLQSPSFMAQKRALATGTKVIDVSAKQLEKVRVPVPPLPVQQEIVRILDEFSQLEAELEAELEARRRQYEHYHNATVGKSQFEDCEWVPLSNVATIRTGSKPEQITPSGSISYINAGNEASGFVEEANTRGGVITIPSRGQGGAGHVGFQSSDFWCGPLCYRIDSKKSSYLNRFLYFFLRNAQNELVSLRKTGSIPAVNKSDLGRFPIPVVDISEQNHILSVLNSFDALVNDLSIGLPAELAARRKQYEYYRDKLLTFKELER